MKKNLKILVLITILAVSCMDNDPVGFPTFGKDTWLRVTKPIPDYAKPKIEGIYEVTEGNDFAGKTAVLKWNDSVLSVYTGVDYLFMVMKSGYSDSSFIFEGFWHNNQNITSGLVRLTIKKNEGGYELINPTSEEDIKNIIISGAYGKNNEYPMIGLSLKKVKKMKESGEDLMIIAHRGGGRTSDLLPCSENSCGILKLAQQFGAKGVEIDVRLTKDGVPILYHDEHYTSRLVNGEYIIGAVSDYTYKQIRTFCTLKDGTLIPTLREALNTVLYDTKIELVWLDTKAPNLIDSLIKIQKEYYSKRDALGRKLRILIGLPDDAIYNEFLNHPKHLEADALCEIGLEQAIKSGAKIWAPRWTLGMMTDEIKQAHEKNIKVFLWTLDDSEFIDKFVQEGLLDGILTNFPSRVAWEYYEWKNK